MGKGQLKKRGEMNIKGKKFVVIGGAGLIGSHTVEELLKEDVKEVVIYDNFTRGSEDNLKEALKDPRAKIYEVGGDIMHKEILGSALKGADGVFHFAALWLLHCWDYPDSAFDVNIRGTYNVVQACIQQNVKRLIYSSSASVYGDALQEPMNEDHPYNNNNFYGATKIAGEHICRSLYHRYVKESDFSYVGLRYMNVYGPKQDYHGAYIAVIMKMLDKLDKGEAPEVFGDGNQSYDFVYVQDCAKANVCAMKAKTNDEFYNVGTGIRTSIKTLAEKILKITGSDLEIKHNPAGSTFVKNRVGCPKKAEADLSFVAQKNLDEGLLELIRWRESHKGAVRSRQQKVGINE